MASLNFKTSLWLDVKGFRKDVAQAQRALNDLTGSFRRVTAAVAGTIGFGAFFNGVKNTVTQLSVARATLENVSSSMGEYRQNLKFVDELSKTYKQDLIGLTESFAKFHAASVGTNVSLEQQKEIFKALTQASTFFHLSADKTNNVMMAVEQMMSKGKVSAEELRRQLGNNLPGAVNMMYQAYTKLNGKQNVTFAQFEKLMAQGKIMSAEVLPEFAKRLNELTNGFSTESLQLSMNELQNAWTRFADSKSVENFLSGTYKMLAKLLGFARENIVIIASLITTVLIGTAIAKLILSIEKLNKASLTWSKNVKLALKTNAWTAVIMIVAELIGYMFKLNAQAKEYAKNVKNMRYAADDVKKYNAAYAVVDENEDWLEEHKDEYEKAVKQLEEKRKKNPRAKGKIGLITEYQRRNLQYIEAKKVIKEFEDNLNAGLDDGDGGGGADPDKTLQKQLEKYKQAHDKLDFALKNGTITAQKYGEELWKLTKKYYELIASDEDYQDNLATMPQKLKDVAKGLEEDYFLYGRIEEQVAKANEELEESLELYEKQLEEQEKLRQARKQWDKEFGKGGATVLTEPTRNSATDYKKERSDINGEWEDIWDKQAKKIQDAIDELVKIYGEDVGPLIAMFYGLDKAMEKAKQNAKDFSELKDLEQIKEDLKDTRMNYFDSLINGTQNFASALNTLTKSWQKLNETFEDAESGWEKFLLVLNEAVQVFNTLQSVIDGINKMTEISNKLKMVSMALTAKQAGTDLVEAGAAGKAAAAEAAKSQAGIPFVGPALAVAAVAAIVAAIAAAGNKFANGGIVGGHSFSGDKVMAGLNSGEMVLNKGQQATLWNMLNGKTGFGGGHVDFRIRGKDLVGTIQNYQSQIRG